MKSETGRIKHELNTMKDKIKENTEKIKINKTLPYLVSNVVEVNSSYTYFKFLVEQEYSIVIITRALLPH